MRPRSRRRRAVLLAALALASGGLAASQVESSMREVEAQVGTPVPVVLAREDLPAGTKLEVETVERSLEVEEIPQRFVPPDSLASPEEAVGLRTAVPLAPGSYVTIGDLETASLRREVGPALAPGERVVELAVAGSDSVAAAGPGVRVDVLITTEGQAGAGRTYVALQNVELLDVRPARDGIEAGGGDGPALASMLASLRVTVEQAALLTSAQNFAREVRLLARSPDDRKRVAPTSVSAGDL